MRRKSEYTVEEPEPLKQVFRRVVWLGKGILSVTDKPPGAKGRSCWAAHLGGCHEKISGEHIVTQSLFTGKTVIVSGLPWCLSEPKEVGKAGITRNILCRTHNSALSVVDEAAQKSFEVFRQSTDLSSARQGINAQSLMLKRFRINGRLLERWFLKTVINGS